MRQRAFVDTSELFAATHSRSGRARALSDAGVDARLDLYASAEVVDVVSRNLAKKSLASMGLIEALLVARILKMVAPAPDEIVRVAKVVEEKDAHVIAAAMAANAPVATYDRRHLLSQADLIRETFGVEVLTPEEVLRRLANVGEQPKP